MPEKMTPEKFKGVWDEVERMYQKQKMTNTDSVRLSVEIEYFFRWKNPCFKREVEVFACDQMVAVVDQIGTLHTDTGHHYPCPLEVTQAARAWAGWTKAVESKSTTTDEPVCNCEPRARKHGIDCPVVLSHSLSIPGGIILPPADWNGWIRCITNPLTEGEAGSSSGRCPTSDDPWKSPTGDVRCPFCSPSDRQPKADNR